MTDTHLHELALAWALAYRARTAAGSVKRRTTAARRTAGSRYWSEAFEIERAADRRLAHARAEFRRAEKNLLLHVDPKPVTLRGKIREIPPAPALLITSSPSP